MVFFLKRKCLIFLLLLINSTLFSKVIYVNATARGQNNGTSWTDAYLKLQDAITKTTFGDTIWVAQGSYYPDEGTGYKNNNRDHSFNLVDGVAFYGGFAGTESNLDERNWLVNQTILSGEIQQNNGIQDNTYTIVKAIDVSDYTILDGFIITKGLNESNLKAGGLYCKNGNMYIRNCIFSHNKSLINSPSSYSAGGY